MRYPIAALLLVLPVLTSAQSLTAADSALVGRILTAEDRRDSTDASLAEGRKHADARIRTLAQRARWRIRDPRFVARDSLPPLPAPKVWPEPAWKPAYRALTDKSTCEELRAAIYQREYPYSLRAVDLEGDRCASDATASAFLRLASLDASTAQRDSGRVAWQLGAHAIVALARMHPDDARANLGKITSSPIGAARVYGARAAAILLDTATLLKLAGDKDDNVKEAAVVALSKLAAHTRDSVYLVVLKAPGAQAVRAAAIALKGSPRADVKPALNAMFDTWVSKQVASARDVRVALLDAAGRPATDDKPPALDTRLPPDAIRLALGADIRLRVTMSRKSGGGSFVVRLRGDIAPIMGAKILNHVRGAYYSNGVWHRVEHDFVIQGAGPGNYGMPFRDTPAPNEYVGADSYLRDELGNVPHTRGTIGMSTRSHDTGDAQWFVNLKDNRNLGRDYTVFAEVIEGMHVVDGILEGDVIESIREVPPSSPS